LNVSLIVNPIAGNRAARSIKRIEGLLRDRVSHSTFTTRKKGDALAIANRLSATDLVLVAGGDGTFNEVINGVLSSQSDTTSGEIPPLALIPLGTTNVLATELGIPLNIEKAVQLALTGSPKKISLGRINNRYFSLMAGIGFDGETVCNVRDSVKKISGKGAYILSGMNTLLRYRPPMIQVKTPSETFTGFTAVVGKSRCYAGKFQVTPRADVQEPALDVCLLKSKTRKSMLKFIGGVITKKHLDFSNVVYRKVKKVEITSKDRVNVQIDGDYFGMLPVTIDVVENAIRVVW
jgi:YegS/Rv2252/BmrU family lipid kinase